MQNRQFARCEYCNLKPATLRRFVSETECKRLCYHCDDKSPNLSEYRKEIIPYDEMVQLSSKVAQTDSVYEYGRQKPNNQNYDSDLKRTFGERQLDYLHQQGSPVKRTPIKSSLRESQIRGDLQEDSDFRRYNQASQQNTNYKNQHPIRLYNSNAAKDLINDQTGLTSNDLWKSETKAIELKYRIKLQEQENTIQLMKQHMETIEHKYLDNLQKAKFDLQRNEEISYREQEKHVQDVQRMKSDFEIKLQSQLFELEQEKQRNSHLEQKLDNLRKTYESKTLDLQQQITQLRAEIERLKMERERVFVECDQQISLQRQQAFEENERVLNSVKSEFTNTINEYREKLSQKMDQCADTSNQVGQLQTTLRELENVWQRKVQLVERDCEDYRYILLMYKKLRLKLHQEHERGEKLHHENKNLFSELNILQKEVDLFQEEKSRSRQQLHNIVEKNQKLERFIYGSKKGKKK